MNIIKKIGLLSITGMISSQVFMGKVFAKALSDLGADSYLPDFFTGQSITVENLTKNIILLMLIAAAVIAVIFIIWGGYQYITSAGDAEKAGKGRATLINAIIGLVVIFIAYALAGWLVTYFTT